jgi:hypothetical protein
LGVPGSAQQPHQLLIFLRDELRQCRAQLLDDAADCVKRAERVGFTLPII